MKTKNEVYADNASTTKIEPNVLTEMIECFNLYGNPSSAHKMGINSSNLINVARNKISGAINSKDSEIYFTSGGSESNNLAIKGFAKANIKKGNHIITSVIEHPSILNTMKYLENNGFIVDYISVYKDGVIDLAQLKNAIRDDTILISIMFANNEIGTIQPIKEIGEITKENSICFHTDAVQAIGCCNIDVQSLNIDMLSLSGHKFYAPKGIGALYVKNGIKLDNLIHGGHQEKGLRAGTENVPYIVGMGKAIKIASQDIINTNKNLIKLRDRLINEIETNIPNAYLNGHRTNRLPGNISFSFENIESESLLFMLNMNNIYASGGSACSSGSLNPSHVITSIGVNEDLAHSTIRFSLGKYNTIADINYIMSILPDIAIKLRSMKNA